MELSVNNTCGEKSYTAIIDTKSKCESENADELKSAEKSKSADEEKMKKKKKKQIISEKEGQYYCTYIVNEDGKKILMKKIPVYQVEKQNKSQELMNFDFTNCCDDKNVNETARAVFQYNQQLHKKNAHKKDLQEMIDILKKDCKEVQNEIEK